MSRLGRLLCWVRGYHEAHFNVTSFEKPDVFGESSPCFCCGIRLPQGRIPDAYVMTVWPFEPKARNL